MNRFCALLVANTLVLTGSAIAQAPNDSIARSIVLTSHYLHFPVKRGVEQQKFRLYVDGAQVREFDIEMAAEQPDYWVHTDVSAWKGKTIVVRPNPSTASKVPPSVLAKELALVTQSNQKDGEGDRYQEPLRPQFHYTPLRGWLGDANGLVYDKGEWHLFYQHNPFGTAWGNMTWGHAVSPDLVHWKELDNAIQPDQLGMIFTGSAVVDEHNTTGFGNGKEAPMVALYSYAGGFNEWSQGQGFTQALTYSVDRGRHWTKYAKNPVLDLGGSSRDPKVFWYAPANEWVMIIWIDNDIYGLYASPDMKTWKELQQLKLGFEMPDMFEIALDGDARTTKWIITGPSDWYVVGTFDGKSFTVEQEPVQGDLGPNYGAVSTFNNVPPSDGRRIQQGWLRGASVDVAFDFPGTPFNQQMAFPRELTLHSTPQGYRLFGVPAREIRVLHKKAHHWANVRLSSSARSPITPIRTDLSHVKATFMVDTTQKSPESFGFDMRGYKVVYNTSRRALEITSPHAAPRSVPVPSFNGPMTWEILQDRASVEVFINGGIVRMATGYIPDAAATAVQPIVSGGTVPVKQLDIFELKSAWR